jgi:hypothetical protein
MAQRGAPDHWDSVPNPPSVVQVTVEPGPRGRPPMAHAARSWAFVIVSLLVAGAVGGGVLLVSGGGGGERRALGSTASIQAGPRLRGTAQVASVTEAYRFPLGCMSMTITPEAMAHVLRSRTGPCWRYGVFITAVLRQTGGVWRLGLEATSRSCPRIALPASIRAELAVCRR